MLGLFALCAAVIILLSASPGSSAAPVTVCASRNADGAILGGFQPALSPDGRYVAFASRSAGYVDGTSPFAQIYLKNLVTGGVRLMSISPAGFYGNEESFGPVVSRDGERVVFGSAATNLTGLGNDNNNQVDVFARNPNTGQSFLISRSTSNAQGNFESLPGDVTPDSLYTVFSSGATTFQSPDQSYEDIWIRDSVAFSTTRVSVSKTGGEPDSNSRTPVISNDGRMVAFQSSASDLLDGDTEVADIYVRDRTNSVTLRASTTADGTPANADSSGPAVSGNGRFVAFVTAASNLAVNDENGKNDVYVKDLDSGAIRRVSVGAQGIEADEGSTSAALSETGRYIAFISTATNIAPGAMAGDQHVYARDLETGATVIVSVLPDGTVPRGHSTAVSISDDGQYVAFASTINGLVADDANGMVDVFVRGPLWEAPVGGFSATDIGLAMRMAAGIISASPDEKTRLNIATEGVSANAIDVQDAQRIARKVAGLDT